MLILLASACLEARPPAAQACDACHGAAPQGAPPTALGGATEPSARGVGAHQAHLTAATGVTVPVACAECHLVPTAADDEGHVDSSWPAEVTWANGVLAKEGGEPFDAAGLTCVVYCHGATMDGGPDTSPAWTDEQDLGCTGCHGAPPPPPHPDAANCAGCHANVGAVGFVDPALHIDGIVQLETATTTPTTGETGTPTVPNACVGCHGAGENPAPPPDTAGSSDTTRISVGAHEAHVLGTAEAAAVACVECHLPYAAVSDAGHLGDAAGDVTFGPIAVQRAHRPVWDGLTCADSYCHDFGGGTVPAPEWTTVDGSQIPCDGCHAAPPADPHPPAPNGCATAGGCHDTVFAPGLPHTIVDPSLHANGAVNF